MAPQQQSVEGDTDPKSITILSPSEGGEGKGHHHRAESKFSFITKEDYNALSALYDKDHDGKLSDEDLNDIIEDYNKNRMDKKSKAYEIVSKYDVNQDGAIDIEELEAM